MATVAPFASINYTLSLSSDPLTGPFTTSVKIALGTLLSIRLAQQTAGPYSYVSVSFGDGSPLQNYTLGNSSPNYIYSYIVINYNYMRTGTYTIVATPYTALLNVTTNINTVTVNVLTSLNIYPSKLKIHLFQK
jgi:hypothetical protein